MQDNSMLSEQERGLLGDLFRLWGDSSRNILSSISGNDLRLSRCDLHPLEMEAWEEDLASSPYVFQEVTFSGDLLGSAYIVISRREALVLIDHMIGGDGKDIVDDFGELHFSVFAETTSQMAGSLVGIIANSAARKINILPREIKLNDHIISRTEPYEQLTLAISLGGAFTVEIRLIWPLPLIASLAALVGGAKLQEEAVPHGQAHRSAVSPQESEALRLSQPAIFSQLTPEQGKEKSENIDLILDIPVSIKAFLGKSELTLRELIELAPGKVFELDKFAGEPIDLIVNDRLVAHGEIIIMDEKFGVKVMDVLGKAERLYNLR